MAKRFGIVTPAFRAERWIAACVNSLVSQTYADWEQWIIADDGADYEAILAHAGIRDARLHFISTGRIGAGSSHARNLGLDRLMTDYAALLDADDRFKPGKLAAVLPALDRFNIVSTAIEEFDQAGQRLRLVGEGADKELGPATYKWTNLSMDSMIVWNRSKTDARTDEVLRAMTDLDLLMRLFKTAPSVWHIGTPLHDYLKLTVSVSNGPGVTERMVGAKREMLRRLGVGEYPMADPAGPAGMARFLEISLEAEQTYEAALAARPGLLFEDHLEPLLRTASTSAA